MKTVSFHTQNPSAILMRSSLGCKSDFLFVLNENLRALLRSFSISCCCKHKLFEDRDWISTSMFPITFRTGNIHRYYRKPLATEKDNTKTQDHSEEIFAVGLPLPRLPFWDPLRWLPPLDDPLAGRGELLLDQSSVGTSRSNPRGFKLRGKRESWASESYFFYVYGTLSFGLASRNTKIFQTVWVDCLSAFCFTDEISCLAISGNWFSLQGVGLNSPVIGTLALHILKKT